MPKKLIAIFSLILIFVLGLCLTPVSAKNLKNVEQDIPEIDGTYDVLGHPEMKVRVFVHNPKADASEVLMCGLDPDSSAFVGSAGWHLPKGDWTYKLNISSVPSSVGASNLPAIATDAFSRWSGAIGGKINFVAGNNTSATRAKLDGQNIITWGRASGSALAVTYTWYYTATKEVAEVDTIMNQKFPWFWSGNGSCLSGAYDAQDILTHELGHWMGLKDYYTSNFVNNTMYGYGAKGETKKDTLTNGDILGAQAIY